MKTVIEMAKKAGFTEGELAFMGDNFIRFAELVRADAIAQERNACMKEADMLRNDFASLLRPPIVVAVGCFLLAYIVGFK